MNYNVFTSLFLGLCMGAAYGWLFLRRIKNYGNEALVQATRVRRSVFVFVSFAISYAAAGIFIYCFMKTFHVNMILSAVAFLVAFWVVVWRYAKTLS